MRGSDWEWEEKGSKGRSFLHPAVGIVGVIHRSPSVLLRINGQCRPTLLSVSSEMRRVSSAHGLILRFDGLRGVNRSGHGQRLLAGRDGVELLLLLLLGHLGVVLGRVLEVLLELRRGRMGHLPQLWMGRRPPGNHHLSGLVGVEHLALMSRFHLDRLGLVDLRSRSRVGVGKRVLLTRTRHGTGKVGLVLERARGEVGD